jgi:hypothetical protein
MQISTISGGQSLAQGSQVMALRSEESGEVASSPAEEAQEKGSIAKSAEQARGMGNSIDLLA